MLPKPAKLISYRQVDNLVLPEVTRDYMEKLCRNGSAVAFDPVPKTGHGLVAFRASGAAIDWIAARFAGAPAPTSCRSL